MKTKLNFLVVLTLLATLVLAVPAQPVMAEDYYEATFTFTSTPNPSGAYQEVTFKISATGTHPTYQPYGYVTFYDNGQPIDGCQLVELNHTGGNPVSDKPAVCTTRLTTVGEHTITAGFSTLNSWMYPDVPTIPLDGGQTVTDRLPVTLYPVTLPDGTYGMVYEQWITPTCGGDLPCGSIMWSYDGKLPPGIYLFTYSEGALLTGPPDAVGEFTFTVWATDGGPSGSRGSHTYTWNVLKVTPQVTFDWVSVSGGMIQLTARASHPTPYWWEDQPTGLMSFSVEGVPLEGCSGENAIPENWGAYDCYTNAPEGLQPGAYTVQADFAPDELSAANYNEGSGTATLNMPSTITGLLFRDVNQDGFRDDGEGPVNNYFVDLDEGCDGSMENWDLSDADGRFSIENVILGATYCLFVNESGNWRLTTGLEPFVADGNNYFEIGLHLTEITFSPVSLPNGSVGEYYEQTITIEGGDPPYEITFLDENLPAGMTFDPDTLTLSGTPTAAGYGQLYLEVEDANGFTGWWGSGFVIPMDGVFTLDSDPNPSAPGQEVTFTFSGSPPDGSPYPPIGVVAFYAGEDPIEGCEEVDLNIRFSEDGMAIGDFPATCTTASLAEGSHEIRAVFTGNELSNDATCTLTQQVGQTATYTISGSTFADTDRDGVKDEGESTLNYSWPVYLDQGCEGVADYTTLLADGGYAFSGLPGGECYRITVEIGGSGVKQYTELADITLNGDVQIDIGFNYPPITIDPPSGTQAIPAELPSPIVGEAYYQEFAASGGEAPYGYGIVTSYLPDGMTLSEIGGVLVLSGTPTVGGLYGFEVAVWDATGAPLLDADGYPSSAYYAFVIKTDGDFTFTSSGSPSAPGEAVTFTVSATGDAVILQDPMPPVGWVTFSADGIPIEGCSDLLLNVGASGPEYYPVTCIMAALEAGSHQITATFTDAIEAMLGYRVYNPPSLAPLTQMVGEPLNTAPAANPAGPYLAAINTAIAFDGSLSSDPENDPLTYTWTFGDGGTGTGATPTHAYTATDIYDVCLTVSDGTLSSDPACTMAVVYDPSAGFVTGGGWIMSPEGAYKVDPSLSGKATFGFVSKYKKGASVPEGNTEFQFQGGGFNFHSTTYEWLVVSKDKVTAQIKGSGTVNGALDPNGNAYKFMLWARDSSPDTFRIRIWWEANGTENVVYDNGFEQAIGGGSIVVHTGK